MFCIQQSAAVKYFQQWKLQPSFSAAKISSLCFFSKKGSIVELVSNQSRPLIFLLSAHWASHVPPLVTSGCRSPLHSCGVCLFMSQCMCVCVCVCGCMCAVYLKCRMWQGSCTVCQLECFMLTLFISLCTYMWVCVFIWWWVVCYLHSCAVSRKDCSSLSVTHTHTHTHTHTQWF